MTESGQFPFGAPVRPCGDGQPEPTDAFVLGAYPSAIHVRWVPPRASGRRPISALAVDNEPTVFWDGTDADQRVDVWRKKYFDPSWGEVSTARLNGPSGSWLRSNILDPLRAAGADSHFITDCLTTYRLSGGALARLNDTYEPFARETRGLPSADLLSHPSEAQIVREALKCQSERLTEQIAAARPRVLVTLGNAASRVIASLGQTGKTGKIAAEKYGEPSNADIAGAQLTWIALVHPATPAVWQERHREWIAGTPFRF